jgi:cation:H+ antiporter
MYAYLLVVAGFVFLIKGADLLIDGASSMAKRFKIPDLVIGLTIVAFGTSAPELVVNIFASLQNNAEIAIGNILGSNIANIFLILGVASIIYPLKVTKGTVWKEIPLSLLAAIILGVMANDALIDGGMFSGLTRIDGIVFLAFFLIFMYYAYGVAKNGNGDDETPNSAKLLSKGKSILYMMAGITGLFAGGKFVVDGAVEIAQSFGVSELLIGLTVVAIGTSLPELVTSVMAAMKKNSDIAVGNAVGSNIFNIFLVLGTSAVINPIPFNVASNFDITMTITASFLLFLVMFIGKKHILERWQGAAFIVIYVLYILFLLMRG